jgi:tRNA dimethylallyltransferase
VVALACKSELDLSAGLVAAVSPGRTANRGYAAPIECQSQGSGLGHGFVSGHDFSRAASSDRAALKGHDFSRAETSQPKTGALAPEVSSAQPDALPLAVILLGPTASGKTALSLALAERFGGEIVSCDSVAVYRGMELGTAKPTREKRARVPHHLIDVAEPNEPFTAGAYSRAARAALGEIAARGRLPIVTGGTGLYLRALTEGLFAGPARHEILRARLRKSAERHGSAWLHGLLTRLDPATAARIHSNDTPKLIRAIEVCVATRSPLSTLLQNQGKNPLTGFRLVRIGLNPPREALYERINARCAQMFAAGLVEETRGLLERYGPVKALDSLGYRQGLAVLAGTLSVEAAIPAAQQGHRNYAKRQMTWFRREPQVHWIAGFGDDAETIQAAEQRIESELENRTAN